MSTYNIADAKAHLSELVEKALLGEEVIIARANRPLLKLVPVSQPKGVRQPGSGKDRILFVAPDFDETPADFAAYL